MTDADRTNGPGQREENAVDPQTPPRAEGAGGSRPASEIERDVIAAMKTVFDPEIPSNIYDMGLIYAIDVRPETNAVTVRMTLTSPHCPAAQSLPQEVQVKTAAVEGVSKADVDIVWDPPWDPKMMSDAARLQLGMDL